MYEEIRKPRLLRNMPLLLIRALPPIYYFCRFAGKEVDTRAQVVFESHLSYLAKAVELLGNALNSEEFRRVKPVFSELQNAPAQTAPGRFEKITIELARLCTKFEKKIQPILKQKRVELVQLYLNNVQRLKVLIVDNNDEAGRVDKLSSILENFCYYRVDRTTPDSPEYASKLIAADFVLFSSTHPPQIHDEVKALKTYRKPGLALATIEIGDVADKQSIRHGAQLLRNGFQVLFKVFTPVRLFTSIDKIYMKHRLELRSP
ncbi:MAG TPA: hypothetical protein ENK14_08805 [Caldithrix sp.]|nr:hypothetical protein [Caldithrix sp.]